MSKPFTVVRPANRRSPAEDNGEIEQAELDKVNAKIVIVDFDNPDQLYAILPEADGLMAAGVCTREMIEAMPQCRAIVTVSHGFDKIDLEAATEHGLPVSNTYFCHEEVANHTIALLLAFTRKIVPLHQKMVQGIWDPASQPPVPPLSGQTMGLIGFGHIGQEVAKRARSFGINVIAADPNVDEATGLEHGVTIVELDEIFKTSDYVSIHVPLDASTFQLVNAEKLSMMKPEALLINTARGPIVDEAALIEALQNGTIAGAALDVFEQEPTLANNPLYQMDNVLLTPHAAGYSDRSTRLGRELAARTMATMLAGTYPEWFVNTDVAGNTRFQYE